MSNSCSSHGCSCCHEEHEEESLPRKGIKTFIIAFLLWGLGLLVAWQKPLANMQLGPFLVGPFLPLIPFLGSYFFAGLPVLRNAFLNLKRGHALDENFLMSIATIGAFAIGEWEEAAGVMIFYMIGELIQEAAVNRSRSSINALLALKPDKARIQDGEGWAEVSPADVAPGTLVLVRPGERFPLDGVVEDGAGSIDASMLTGEARPVAREAGEEVRSGTLSVDGVFRIRTTRTADDSSAARIIKLVESAKEAKAKPERFITAFARWYTPIVVGFAVLLSVVPPLVIPGARFSEWFYRALILLVISCPCALVVSVPLGYFAGIGGMSRRGIMVKGAVHLDMLNRTQNVAFDKTGTLTRGKFSVIALEPAPGTDEEDLLAAAIWAEQESNHPIAEAIRVHGKSVAGGEPRPLVSAEGSAGSFEKTASRREIAGQGLEIEAGTEVFLAGNRRLLESRGVLSSQTASSVDEDINTAVYLARSGKYMGRILIGDTLKLGAVEAIRELKQMGIRNTVMFTGDNRGAAMETASKLGITSVEAGLLPEDKLFQVEKLTKTGTTVFVGDGINDAPVLARSHVGIAMGSGADAAVEAADIIVMTDDPRRVPEAIERARRTHRIILQNVVFALGAKGMFITLAVMGEANMWLALIADVGVALIAILNSARALR
ncbi:heavy metal translocating P-type ATPase [Leadbettera azotonutricia]|uniref:P-type Zn(2+) transporter n=1 Tax=Leadbettera azotonutricia (strain ATCC BAA-888 / DSM 13862 / ZAS-9) TaxID=545695 RepID=F5YCR0_LEAAZ|nr:heavy metal translocating P-type ATPase [Leadbettera azotonutricia]AEF82087.1 cadmium-exporting ATPase [Leadbettera azotonutricia ZAS-9]